MIPVLFELGPIKIHSYGLMMATGLIIGHWLQGLELSRRGLDDQLAYVQLFVSSVGGVLGARIFDILEHPQGFWDHPIKTLTSASGLTWYGGVVVVLPVMYFVIRRLKNDYATIV